LTFWTKFSEKIRVDIDQEEDERDVGIITLHTLLIQLMA